MLDRASWGTSRPVACSLGCCAPPAIDAVYGCPLPGVDVVVDRTSRAGDAGGGPPPGPRPACRGARLRASSSSGRPTGRRTRRTSPADDLLDLVPLLASGPAWLRLAARPRRPGARRRPAAARPGRPLDRARATQWSTPCWAPERPVVLAGPGVVADGAVPGLHALAAAASLGVLNTWGAKGVFDWRSRHHLATAGLQQHDFTLAGLGDADLIVATGVDAAEAPDALWRDLAPVVERAALGARPAVVAGRPSPRRDPDAAAAHRAGPGHAGGMGLDVGPAGPDARDPPLRPGHRRWWPRRRRPRASPGTGSPARSPRPTSAASRCRPTRAPARVRRSLRAGGPAAHAVPSRPRGGGRAPSTPDDGGGAADAAARLGVPIPLAVWDPAGPALDADDHLARVRAAVVADAPEPVVLATDPAQLGRMVDGGGRGRGLGRDHRRGVTSATPGRRPLAGPRYSDPHGVAGGSLRTGGPARTRPIDGVPGHRHAPAPRGGDQAGPAARRPGGRRAGARPGAARGPGHGPAQQPGHGHRLRRRRGVGRHLARDGAGRRAQPRRARCRRGAAAPRPRRPPGAAGAHRARGRPPGRRGAPRREAGERARGRGRPRQAHRLRGGHHPRRVAGDADRASWSGRRRTWRPSRPRRARSRRPPTCGRSARCCTSPSRASRRSWPATPWRPRPRWSTASPEPPSARARSRRSSAACSARSPPAARPPAPCGPRCTRVGDARGGVGDHGGVRGAGGRHAEPGRRPRLAGPAGIPPVRRPAGGGTDGGSPAGRAGRGAAGRAPPRARPIAAGTGAATPVPAPEAPAPEDPVPGGPGPRGPPITATRRRTGPAPRCRSVPWRPSPPSCCWSPRSRCEAAATGATDRPAATDRRPPPRPATARPPRRRPRRDDHHGARGRAAGGLGRRTRIPSGAYTIGHPPGWEVSPVAANRTDFRDPATGAFVRVEWTDTPGADAAGAWRDASPGSRRATRATRASGSARWPTATTRRRCGSSATATASPAHRQPRLPRRRAGATP